MKKHHFIFIFFIFFTMSMNVSAKTTPHGINIDNSSNNFTELYCDYGGVSVRINETDHIEIYPDAESKEAKNFPFKNRDINELKSFGFLDENGNWDCPLYGYLKGQNSNIITTFTNDLPPAGTIWKELDVAKSNCEGKCSIYTPTTSKASCKYKSGNKSLTVEKENNNCTVTYPDGKTEKITGSVGVCGMVSENSCPDLYYNNKSKEIKWAMYDYSSWFTYGDHYEDSMFKFLCETSTGNIEYYCVGTCEHPSNKNINCNVIREQIGEDSATNTSIPPLCEQQGVLKSFRFIGYLLFIVKILVPIILIIMGSMDFGKAIVASNQDAVQKAAKMFGIRIVAGVSIFLLPTVVNFIFGLLPSAGINYSECRKCLFHPNDCNLTQIED